MRTTHLTVEATFCDSDDLRVLSERTGLSVEQIQDLMQSHLASSRLAPHPAARSVLVRRASRLTRDFELDETALRLILQLLAEIAELQSALRHPRGLNEH